MSESQAQTLPISVVIPAYNRAGMIARALRSIAAQSPARAAEVIVVDDASTDDTVRVAREMGARVVRHDENRGAAGARNTGYAAATQPWVALLDSDDEWLPHHLETLWRLRDDHVLVAASALGRPTKVAPRGVRSLVHGTAGKHPLVLRSPRDIIAPQPISASAVMVRTEIVTELGGHDLTRRYGEDWDLWLRLLERGTGVVAPTVTAVVHLHVGGKHLQGDATYDGWRAILSSYADRPWFDRRAARRWETVVRWDQLRDAMRAGRRREALRHLRSLASPNGIVTIGHNYVRRASARRRVFAVGSTGKPTLALLPGAPTPADGIRQVRDIVDLSAGTERRALLALARQPTAEAWVRTDQQARLVAALKVTPIRDL
jgi:glycosyltransferase involved in cell wall biosynthesis